MVSSRVGGNRRSRCGGHYGSWLEYSTRDAKLEYCSGGKKINKALSSGGVGDEGIAASRSSASDAAEGRCEWELERNKSTCFTFPCRATVCVFVSCLMPEGTDQVVASLYDMDKLNYDGGKREAAKPRSFEPGSTFALTSTARQDPIDHHHNPSSHHSHTHIQHGPSTICHARFLRCPSLPLLCSSCHSCCCQKRLR